ncbi:MAG: hypothetical protein JRI68_17175 [Deltaproteobacteria bacterium]|nr:hypothetical protein [Deltaproteobacteria bacterium]
MLPLVSSCGSSVNTGGGAGPAGGSGGAVGGSGGSGGEGGAGICPVEYPDMEQCDQPGLRCSYGPGHPACCRCEDISCAVLWLCVVPEMSDASCPTEPPSESSPCDGDPTCYYCESDDPLMMFCKEGEWTEGMLAGCM